MVILRFLLYILYVNEFDQGGNSLCPTVQAAFDLLGKKWTGLILRRLLGGPLCFSELVRAVSALSPRMLALRVKELEVAGIVARTVSRETPVRVTYSLTLKGKALEPVMKGIEDWAREWDSPRTNETDAAVAQASALG